MGEDGSREFYEILTGGVQEGLRGSLYHLHRFLELEAEAKRLGAELVKAAKPKGSGTLGLGAQTLISEFESFTLMSRATLDRLARFIGFYYNTYDRNLYKLRKTLSLKKKDARAQAVAAAISRHQDYLDTLISSSTLKVERDRLAHREYISWTTINIVYWQDGTFHVIAVPAGGTSPSDEAGKLLEDRFEKLGAAVQDVVLAFFSPSGELKTPS